MDLSLISASYYTWQNLVFPLNTQNILKNLLENNEVFFFRIKSEILKKNPYSCRNE